MADSYRVREILRKTRTLRWGTGVMILAVLMIVLLWKVPQAQVEKYVNAAQTDGKPLEAKDRFNIENDARRTLATVLGAIIVLGGAYFTWRNIKVAQEGQITDRFTKAIEQLGAIDANGKKKLEVRLGGIYAPERIANQSERDHWPIVEVLSTYLRENAPCQPQEPTPENQPSAALPPLAADIQAILTVLVRRDRKHERESHRLDLSKTDMHGARLGGANLGGVDLSKANLSGAGLSQVNLSGAGLSDADLSLAFLYKANLSDAGLTNANLRDAYLWEADLRARNLYAVDFSGANLTEANLSGTDLPEANLSRTNLRGTHLHGAYLKRSKGLTQEQLEEAKGDSATELPEDLHRPESWKP